MNILQQLLGGVHITEHDALVFLMGVVASGLFGRIHLGRAYRTVRRARRVAGDVMP